MWEGFKDWDTLFSPEWLRSTGTLIVRTLKEVRRTLESIPSEQAGRVVLVYPAREMRETWRRNVIPDGYLGNTLIYETRWEMERILWKDDFDKIADVLELQPKPRDLMWHFESTKKI